MWNTWIDGNVTGSVDEGQDKVRNESPGLNGLKDPNTYYSREEFMKESILELAVTRGSLKSYLSVK